MRPILVTISQDVVVVLGFVLIGLGALWLAVVLWRWRRANDPSTTTSDRLTGLATAVLIAAVGGLATRYTGLGVPLYSYGIFLGLGFVLGFVVALRFADNLGVGRGPARLALALAILVGLAGARAVFVLQHWELFKDLGWRALVGIDREAGVGGLSAFAGLAAGTFAAALTIRFRGGGFWSLADAASPGLAVGLVFLRLGSFFFGSDYGKPAPGFPLAVRFPGLSLEACRGAPAFEHHCACIAERAPKGVDCTGISGTLAQEGGTFASLPVHPIQLYEAGVGVALLFVLWLMSKRRVFEGQVFLAFLLFYSVTRYLTEMLRDDLHPVRIGIFTPTQLLAVIAVPIGIASAVWLLKWRRLDDRVPKDPAAGLK